MDLSGRAHRLQKYKELAVFLWKHGHSEFVNNTGLNEWLGSHGVTKLSSGNGDGHSLLSGFHTVVQTTEERVQTAEKTDELLEDLRNLGFTYVRIAQLLSRRPDILPAPLAEFLSSQDLSTTPMGMVELDSTVRTELGLPLAEIYPNFQAIPLTVSPFDQTHTATLTDGRRVIVKIQRSGVREQVYDDFETMEEIADLCDHHTKTGKLYSFRSIVDELRRTIFAELDYRQESHNLHHLQEALKELDHIVVPDPVTRYSTSRLLTIKYIDGRKLTDSSQLGLLAAEKAALAGEIFHAYLKQILVDGFVHGDPNPNNILFTTSGKLALLDLGVVTRVSTAMQEKLLQILVGINEGRSEHVADLILNIGNKRDLFDEQGFKQAVEELVLTHRESTSDRLEIGRVFIGISQAAFRSGISLPFELGTLGTTLINLDKVADLLDRDFDSRKFLEKNVTEIMKGHVLRTLTPAHLFQNVLETVDLLEKLPGKVGKILDSVANNELKVTVDAIDEKLLMTGFQKIANRITMGLVLASLIMGASQLMQIKSTFTIWGYPGIAIICFMAAAGCGFALVLEIFISDRRTQQR